MTAARDILIAGGYGVVGRRIAEYLAPLYPDRVVVAGRHIEAARATCERVGHGARARRIDVGERDSVESALAGVAAIIGCVGHEEPLLLREAVTRGLAYTDIAPGLAFGRNVEALSDQARRTGARVVLGTGLAPGISNAMAAALGERLGPLESIETHLVLGVGDEFGPASIAFVFGVLSKPFTVHENGIDRTAQPFTEPLRVHFPPPFDARRARLFPWSDVAFYPKTLGVKTAIGRFSVDPPWVGAFAGAIGRFGSERNHIESSMAALLAKLKERYAGRDQFALVVRARGARGVANASLVGRREAHATAVGAAEILRALCDDEVRDAGIWMPEQVIRPAPFIERLAAHGLHIELTDGDLPRAEPAAAPAAERAAQAQGGRPAHA